MTKQTDEKGRPMTYWGGKQNKQQTAVEFLLRELRIEDLAKGEQLSVVLQICEQAKQMEKEQIMKAFIEGYCKGDLELTDDNI